MPNKQAVVDAFEALGAANGQPNIGDARQRHFGGHTPRVTGAQVLTALGVEVNKARILARRSGDAILRYVADAPLKPLRPDLGLGSSSASSSSASP